MRTIILLSFYSLNYKISPTDLYKSWAIKGFKHAKIAGDRAWRLLLKADSCSLWILTRERALSSSWHWRLNKSFRCFSLETHKSQFAPENKQSLTSLLNLLLPGSIFTRGKAFETHSDANPQQHKKISLKTISDNNNHEPWIEKVYIWLLSWLHSNMFTVYFK